MKKITTVISEGRTFIVAHDEHGFWGIEDKHIGPDGKLTVQLNGISGFLHETIDETINAIIFQTKLDALISGGMNFAEAAQHMMA